MAAVVLTAVRLNLPLLARLEIDFTNEEGRACVGPIIKMLAQRPDLWVICNKQCFDGYDDREEMIMELSGNRISIFERPFIQEWTINDSS